MEEFSQWDSVGFKPNRVSGNVVLGFICESVETDNNRFNKCKSGDYMIYVEGRSGYAFCRNVNELFSRRFLIIEKGLSKAIKENLFDPEKSYINNYDILKRRYSIM